MTAKRDLLKVIEEDHQVLNELLQEIGGTEDQERRETLLERLNDAMAVHVEAEQDVLCRALREDKATTKLADAAITEHAEVRKLLEKLSLLRPEDERWPDRLDDLSYVFEQHVVAEEQDVFGRARQVFSPERLVELGARFEEHRQAHRPV